MRSHCIQLSHTPSLDTIDITVYCHPTWECFVHPWYSCASWYIRLINCNYVQVCVALHVIMVIIIIIIIIILLYNNDTMMMKKCY